MGDLIVILPKSIVAHGPWTSLRVGVIYQRKANSIIMNLTKNHDFITKLLVRMKKDGAELTLFLGVGASGVHQDSMSDGHLQGRWGRTQ